MQSRQTSLPSQWLMADARVGAEREILSAVRRLPRGSGVILLHHGLPNPERQRLARKLRQLARSRGLLLLDEARGEAARVHNVREVARARLKRAPMLLLLSPMYPTRSHPDWLPLPRMRASALLRLSRLPVLALGGMDARRFRGVKALGFTGWAGIDGWFRT